MTPSYVLLEKEQGRTPLQAIEAWKVLHPEYANIPATYAGRLDPMATGKLLVLLGEECKRKDAYTGLDKEYEIEVVLDLSTDTGDALGLPQYADIETHPNAASVRAALKAVAGSHSVPYPPYSSKTVNGKPLFQYSLEGALDTIRIPVHTETIYRSRLLDEIVFTSEELNERVRCILSDVPRSTDPSKELGADFRQDEIRARWQEILSSMDRRFTVLTLRITCGTGAYMRSLASRIAKELGTTGFALSINRTRIGRYRSIGSFGFWSKEY